MWGGFVGSTSTSASLLWAPTVAVFGRGKVPLAAVAAVPGNNSEEDDESEEEDEGAWRGRSGAPSRAALTQARYLCQNPRILDVRFELAVALRLAPI